MSQIPHILLLEDQPADAWLIEQQLRDAALRFEFVCVANKADFERALAEFSPDLILADYTLPDYDGLSALRRAAEWNVTVPFIIVTGSLSEETAVECMKAGATDYVLKERLSRLVPATQRALERRRVWEEKARAERAMRVSQARTRAILEAAIDGIVTTNTDGAIAEFNHAAEEIFGRERAEVVGHHFADMLVAAAARPRCQEQVMALLNARPPGSYRGEITGLRRDETEFPMEWAMVVVATEETSFLTTFVRDLTVPKRTESERERLIRQLQEAVASVKTLRGLLPICASCKKVRDDTGYWHQVEAYLMNHAQVSFTHGFCPDCMEKLYPEVMARKKST